MFDLLPSPVASMETFHAKFDAYNLGKIVVASLDSSSARYRRSEKRLSSDGMDIILVQLLLSGEIQFGSSKQTTYASPGEILIFDLAQPLDNVNVDFRHLSIAVPRGMIERQIPTISRWHGQVLPRQEPAVELLRRHMISLMELAPRLPMESCLKIEEATLSLLCGAMGNDSERNRIGTRHDVLSQSVACHVKRLIRENLGNSRLSPESIAAKLGISRAQLYRIMEPLGGVTKVIRRQRLENCRRDLANRKARPTSISEIAYRWGYESPYTFSNNFKQTYGMTPKDYRAAVLEGIDVCPPETSPLADADFQKWILEMAD